MKINIKKIIYQFYYYSNIIVDRVFWGYFLFIILYHFIISKSIPPALAYLFFTLLGLYLGYKFARKSYEYLKKNQKNI
jgi:hypothetical protein